MDPNKEILLDIDSTSSDSDNDYMTPLKDARKEELLQKEREKLKKEKGEQKRKVDKKRKRKTKKR